MAPFVTGGAKPWFVDATAGYRHAGAYAKTSLVQLHQI